MLSEHSGVSSRYAPDDGSNDPGGALQPVHVLFMAYQNSLMHDNPNADLEAGDLSLENASIQLSSRIIYELRQGSCIPKPDAATNAADHPCVLRDDAGLRSLTDMLSHAAYRLETLGRSISPDGGEAGERAAVLVRIKSMEHLYRMFLAISRIYTDKSQSGVYLQVAREQLRLAREQMGIERGLSARTSGYLTGRLDDLQKLDDQLVEMQRAIPPH